MLEKKSEIMSMKVGDMYTMLQPEC